MKKYLVCYWVERNDMPTDLEDIVEAESITEALKNFIQTHSNENITSITIIHDFIPRFEKYSEVFEYKESTINSPKT
jgi:hypothetical protein